MDCIPRLLISEQVVCLCTTAVTQSSNTNVFSPSLCSQQLSQQVAPFTFQEFSGTLNNQ